jgi:hypothetical protein
LRVEDLVALTELIAELGGATPKSA